MLAELLHKVAGMERESAHKYYPRPSLAGPERCIRQLVYWGNETPTDRMMGERFLHVLNDSSWHEELTADWIRKTAFNLHSEQMEITCAAIALQKGVFPLKGHIDGIVTDMMGTDYLWEHKALNHFSFERYAKGALPLDYLTQCALYIRGLSENTKIDTAILLIKNKNTSAFMDMLCKYDHVKDSLTIEGLSFSSGPSVWEVQVVENIVGDAIAKFMSVDQHIYNGTMPERPYEYGTAFPCSYCSWEETCWAGYLSEQDDLATEVNLEGEIVDLCSLYLEQVHYEGEAKAHKEELKTAIKKILDEANAKSGRAGDYIIQRVVKESERLMKKEEIPPSLLALVTKKVIGETFSVRKAKEKKRGKEKQA